MTADSAIRKLTMTSYRDSVEHHSTLLHRSSSSGHQRDALQSDEIIGSPERVKEEIPADLANVQKARRGSQAQQSAQSSVAWSTAGDCGRSADDPTASCQGGAAASGVAEKRRKHHAPEEARTAVRRGKLHGSQG